MRAVIIEVDWRRTLSMRYDRDTSTGSNFLLGTSNVLAFNVRNQQKYVLSC